MQSNCDMIWNKIKQIATSKTPKEEATFQRKQSNAMHRHAGQQKQQELNNCTEDWGK